MLSAVTYGSTMTPWPDPGLAQRAASTAAADYLAGCRRLQPVVGWLVGSNCERTSTMPLHNRPGSSLLRVLLV